MTSESLDEKALLNKIRTRGYWQVVIRPTSFNEGFLKRDTLFALVSNAEVQMRGRHFPGIDRNERHHIDVDWIGQTTNWDHFLELWRMYRSGQLVCISAMPFDWRDESGWWPPTKGWLPNAYLDLSDMIGHATVVTEFACRLSKVFAPNDRIEIIFTVGNTKDRELILNSPMRLPLRERYAASVDAIPITRQFDKLELAANTRGIALDICAEVISFFGWNPPSHILGDLQKEVIG